MSEFESCGFKAYYIDGFKAPFVKQSNVRIGLELGEVIDMKVNGTTYCLPQLVGRLDLPSIY